MGYESKYSIQSRKAGQETQQQNPNSMTYNCGKGEKRRTRKTVFRSSSRRSTVVASFKKWSTVPHALEWSTQIEKNLFNSYQGPLSEQWTDRERRMEA